MDTSDIPDALEVPDTVTNPALWALENWLNRFAIYRALGRIVLTIVLGGTALLVGAAIVWAILS